MSKAAAALTDDEAAGKLNRQNRGQRSVGSFVCWGQWLLYLAAVSKDSGGLIRPLSRSDQGTTT